MKYIAHVPKDKNFVDLAWRAHFPATRDGLIAVASRQRYAASMVYFLRLFDPSDIFQNGLDFVSRCTEMRLFIEEVRHTPPELLRSPQG